MTDTRQSQDVSSAEITAIYRCVFPNISGDSISKHLVSPEGVEKARLFIDTYDYPLVSLKISLCAGYFLKKVTELLSTEVYDSCISFASGFSSLTYLIAEKNQHIDNNRYFDTDLPNMVNERIKRIAGLDEGFLDPNILTRIQTQSFDIEEAYRNKKNLKDVFPDCHNPIFILDGVSYFLSPECVNWLLEQMGGYSRSAVTMYYWPDDMTNSSLFCKVFPDLNQGMILEELKSFWTQDTLNKFKDAFSRTSDMSLADVEAIFVPNESDRQLTDINTFFPIRLITGENSGSSK